MKSLNYAVVVMGGSAGALSPLRRIAADLNPDIRAAIFVVTHISPDSVSALPHILSRSGPLFATHAIDRAPVAPGRIYIAPPNYHVFLENGVMRVVDWAKENGQRPSIDVLFRSAAEAYTDKVSGVLLSGTLDDGVAGLHSIQTGGGCSIVQEPADALFPDMPQNAISAGAVDVVTPADRIASVIANAVEKALIGGNGSKRDPHVFDERESGRPSVFTCPDCGGTLWELEEDQQLRFRCRTGHAYNANSMVSSQHSRIESSLWSALRLLQERADLLRRMAHRANIRGDVRTRDRFELQALDLQEQEVVLRHTLSDLVTQRRASAS